MTVDRVLAHEETLSYLPIRESFREESQHLRLAASQVAEQNRALCSRGGGEEPLRALDTGLRPKREEAILSGLRLGPCLLGTLQRQQGCGQLESGPRGLEGRATALEAVDRVLQERASAVELAACAGDLRVPRGQRTLPAPACRPARPPLAAT